MTPGSKPIDIRTIDRIVSHKSTTPAVAGSTIGLFLREKSAYSLLASDRPSDNGAEAVLMIHGGYAPALLAFDVPHRDYSWMDFLAREGLDVFAMDMMGYGRSSKPMMDDPANLSSEAQTLIGLPGAPKPPSYPYELVNSDSESADIDCIVDFIRNLRNIDKIVLIGWSGGGCRVGAYAYRHPEKVKALIVLATSNYRRAGPSCRPAPLPRPGAAMTIQTRSVGEGQRWLGTVRYPQMIEPEMPDLIWSQAGN